MNEHVTAGAPMHVPLSERGVFDAHIHLTAATEGTVK